MAYLLYPDFCAITDRSKMRTFYRVKVEHKLPRIINFIHCEIVLHYHRERFDDFNFLEKWLFGYPSHKICQFHVEFK